MTHGGAQWWLERGLARGGAREMFISSKTLLKKVQHKLSNVFSTSKILMLFVSLSFYHNTPASPVLF